MNEGLISAAVSKLLGSRAGAAGLGAAAGFGAAKLAGSEYFGGDSEKDLEKDKPEDNKVNTQPGASTITTAAAAGATSIAADGTPNTAKNAPTGGQWHDIENQYAVNPSKFRIARDWKDGTEGLTPDGSLVNEYTGKEVPQDILHIEPRKGWTKAMTNFDGSPILAGNEDSKPKEPDHPYYHLIRVETGKRYDSLRVGLISLLEKDRYGWQRQHYKDSKVPTIVCSIPGGFAPGGKEQLQQHFVDTKEFMGVWQNNAGSMIGMDWQHRSSRLAHTIDDQIRASSMTMSAGEVEAWYKGTKVQKIGHGLTADSAVGKWWGESITAKGGKFGNGGTLGNLTVSVPTMGDDGVPHVDLYNIFYYGSPSEFNSNGRNALIQMASSAKYAEGFGPIKRRGVNEELNRIIDLIRK